MDGWSVTQQMINYKDKQLKKKFKLKIKARPVNVGHYMAFKHHISLLLIWLQTLVVINSESCQRSFPSICSPPSEVALLFNLNLSRRPFLGQVAFYLLPIGLQTLVALESESCQTQFPSFCAPPFEVAVLSVLVHFESEQINLDLLLGTGFYLEHAVLYLCHIFTQRPMYDSKIKRSDGHCFGRQQRLANSIENFILHEKKVALRCPISTKH